MSEEFSRSVKAWPIMNRRPFYKGGQLLIFYFACNTSVMGMTHWMILVTYCMVQNSSWEANCFAVSQEIPHISRNPKVHYRTHKRPPPLSILDQPNPVHIPTSHLLEIHHNIFHPSTPRSSQWSLSLRFPHQDPIQPPLLTHKRHMASPSLSSLDDIHIIIIQVAVWFL